MADPPLIVFAPGAGAPSTSEWMQTWAAALRTVGDVVAFDYPYRRQGRRAPDRLPVLIAAHREALAQARAGRRGRVFLAGKSMGGRIGCHVSLEERVDGLICFGYPLKAAGPSGALRDEVLRKLTTPVSFLQGTRDPLCPLDVLADARSRMTAPHVLHVVEGGDHSLLVRKGDLARQGKTQKAVDDEVLAAVASFIQSRPSGDSDEQ
jgi:predicted alpha/beta-hydrolase family hydrolase